MFTFETSVIDFLFQDFNASSVPGFVGICVGVASLAILLESLKVALVHCQQLSNVNPLTYARTQENMSGRSPLLSSLLIPPSIEHIKQRRLRICVAQSLIYLLHLILSYILMLAVMTYNAWMGIAIVLGSGLGYFVFGTWRNKLHSAKPAKYSERTTSSADFLEEEDHIQHSNRWHPMPS